MCNYGRWINLLKYFFVNEKMMKIELLLERMPMRCSQMVESMDCGRIGEIY